MQIIYSYVLCLNVMLKRDLPVCYTPSAGEFGWGGTSVKL